MRAREFVSYDNYLIERFNDTGWLINSIIDAVNNTPLNTKDFDPKIYYTHLLNSIFNTVEFKQIASDIKIIPSIQVSKNINHNDYVLGGKLESVTFKNFLDYFKWNESIYHIKFTLMVSNMYPRNINLLVTDLDNIVGHEIEHLIQRIRRAQDNFNTPGELKKNYYKWILDKNAVLNYDNNTNYINTFKSFDKEVHYYLKHGELLSHAQSVATYLYYAFGEDAIKKLDNIYNLGWKNKLDDYYIPVKSKRILQTYSRLIKQAESEYLISDGHKLWKKLFKEIYRVLINKSSNTALEDSIPQR